MTDQNPPLLQIKGPRITGPEATVKVKRGLRITNIRILSQVFFFTVFVLSVWATWITRLGGYPVSRILELDPLVMISTALATGHVYRFLGWGLVVLAITLLFGRVFCNWICPYGTLHQFVGWLFNVRKTSERWSSNYYRPIYLLKYGILGVLLILSAMGALQIGLLDPICLMYRTVATAVAPASDMAVAAAAEQLSAAGVDAVFLDAFKFAPGAANRVFVGSFWIGAFLATLVGMNLIIPRFFCRVLCPLGALLGVFSRAAVFRIDRDVHKCTDCNLCLTRCEGAADPQGKVRVSECFGCMNCIDDCPEDALRFAAVGLDTKQVVPGTNIGRRKLVLTSVTGLLAYPFIKNHGMNTDDNYSPSLIRPPGSVEEDDFLKKCIKCDQCINACPTNVLQPATFSEAGFEGLWTPVMNFNIGHCQLKCTLCSEVCPTGAIRRITVEEKLGKGAYTDEGAIVLGTAFFDKGRCLPHAMQTPCVVCEEVCPVSPKAIQTVDVEEKNAFGEIILLNKPYIVPELCIGCGICQTECPVTDSRAVYVTAVGESRSIGRRLLLNSRKGEQA